MTKARALLAAIRAGAPEGETGLRGALEDHLDPSMRRYLTHAVDWEQLDLPGFRAGLGPELAALLPRLLRQQPNRGLEHTTLAHDPEHGGLIRLVQLREARDSLEPALADRVVSDLELHLDHGHTNGVSAALRATWLDSDAASDHFNGTSHAGIVMWQLLAYKRGRKSLALRPCVIPALALDGTSGHLCPVDHFVAKTRVLVAEYGGASVLVAHEQQREISSGPISVVGEIQLRRVASIREGLETTRPCVITVASAKGLSDLLEEWWGQENRGPAPTPFLDAPEPPPTSLESEPAPSNPAQPSRGPGARPIDEALDPDTGEVERNRLRKRRGVVWALLLLAAAIATLILVVVSKN